MGTLSDKLNCPCGKRQGWYIFGSLLVVPTFLCIWLDLGFLQTLQAEGKQMPVNIWYCTMPSIFNVGWASVQIANLAIVPLISYS